MTSSQHGVPPTSTNIPPECTNFPSKIGKFPPLKMRTHPAPKSAKARFRLWGDSVFSDLEHVKMYASGVRSGSQIQRDIVDRAAPKRGENGTDREKNAMRPQLRSNTFNREQFRRLKESNPKPGSQIQNPGIRSNATGNHFQECR